MKNILSSHENRPSCICAHGKKEGDINLTLGYVFFDSNHKGKLLIGKGLTCQAKLNEYIIDGI